MSNLKSVALTILGLSVGDVMTTQWCQYHYDVMPENDRMEWKHYICHSLHSLDGDKNERLIGTQFQLNFVFIVQEKHVLSTLW